MLPLPIRLPPAPTPYGLRPAAALPRARPVPVLHHMGGRNAHALATPYHVVALPLPPAHPAAPAPNPRPKVVSTGPASLGRWAKAVRQHGRALAAWAVATPWLKTAQGLWQAAPKLARLVGMAVPFGGAMGWLSSLFGVALGAAPVGLLAATAMVAAALGAYGLGWLSRRLGDLTRSGGAGLQRLGWAAARQAQRAADAIARNPTARRVAAATGDLLANVTKVLSGAIEGVSEGLRGIEFLLLQLVSTPRWLGRAARSGWSALRLGARRGWAWCKEAFTACCVAANGWRRAGAQHLRHYCHALSGRGAPVTVPVDIAGGEP